jgi:ankyrin repeat protein
MSKGMSFIRCLLTAIILCWSVNLHAQVEGIKIDTSEYLPLLVTGALEYNLALASSKGYYTEVERMILMGADVNSETSEGVTPLVYAVYNNRTKAVLTLLQYNAVVNMITARRETPLIIAVKNNNFEIAEILIRYGADVSYPGIYGATSLHFASVYGFLEIADLLLYYDADADIKSYDGTTPLMAAIWSGYANVAELLIRYGANMEATDNEGFTPFLIAAQNGDTLMINLLRQKGVDIYEKNIHDWDALNLAIRSDQEEAVKMLLRIGNRWSDPERNVVNPYSIAVSYRDKKMIDLLETQNFPANKKMKFDQMALSVSCKTDFRDFYSGVSLAFLEPSRNLGIIAGFDTKPWYTRVLIKDNETTFYQYLDRSSLAYAGVLKEFPVTNNLFKSNYYITTSLSAGYSFGNKLKGTLITPGNKFKVIPAVTLKWTKNNFSLISGIEFTTSGFYRIGPLWCRFGFLYNFFFDSVRAPVKNIKWY